MLADWHAINSRNIFLQCICAATTTTTSNNNDDRVFCTQSTYHDDNIVHIQSSTRNKKCMKTNTNYEVLNEAISRALSSSLNQSADRLRMPSIHWISSLRTVTLT